MKYYVMAINVKTGEEWNEGIFDNIKGACEHARYCWGRLAKYDQKHQRIEVRQYAGDIEAEDAPDDTFDYDAIFELAIVDRR